MSADNAIFRTMCLIGGNAIYIRQLPDGKYAVRDCSFSDMGGGESLTDEEIDDRFEGASSFNTSFEAVDEAARLENDSYVEYGIISLERGEPVEGIRGKYTVKVARIVYVDYTFDDVTPEEAADRVNLLHKDWKSRALFQGQDGNDRTVTVVDVTTAE
jgi:hypothetical protein